MDLRTPVKNVLRNCGHAMVSTVHDRLNVIDRLLQDVVDQNTHLAETQTALLQSGIHVVENLTLVQTEVAQLLGVCASKEEVQALIAALGEMRGLAAEKAEIQTLSERVLLLQDILEQNVHIATAQTALLQSETHLVESFSLVKTEIQRLEAQVEQLGRQFGNDFAQLRPVADDTRNFLMNQSVRQVCVETSDYLSTNPELGLFAFLYSYLPSRIALDIGAHVGDVSDYLLKAGFEVYAFEPYPQSYGRLKERLGSQPEFHPLNLALGSVTGEAPMYLARDSSPDNKYEDATVFHSLAQHAMPADLSFTSTVPVKIRKLADLHKEGLVPANAALVKIDTEGYDLEVIRGMDEHRYPVVTVEFWDTRIPFGTQGLLYTVDSMAAEMRQRGYMWYIVIYRVWGQNETAFFCNHDQPVPHSWGNMIFFREHDIFMQAQHWCSAVLPRTYFKHVAAEPERSAKAAI